MALLTLVASSTLSMLNGEALTAVVTGANRGLGFAISQQLGEMGARVVLTSRNATAASEAAAVLSARGLLAEAYDAPLDVGSARSIATFREACDGARYGVVDILVNNAAICEPGWAHDSYKRTMKTNLVGALSLTRAVLPGMLARRRGHVISISSGDGELAYLNLDLAKEFLQLDSAHDLLRLLARTGPPIAPIQTKRSRREQFGEWPAHSPTPSYAISKAALNALTRLAAKALPPPEISGVWLSAVCPGDVNTAMCTAPELAVSPAAAAVDVVWLASATLGLGCSTDFRRRSLQPSKAAVAGAVSESASGIGPATEAGAGCGVSSGSFWRSREELDF